MKITQVSTTDTVGGAARAAHRLFLGLKAIGQKSNMLVLEKGSIDENVQEVKVDNSTCNKTLDKRYKTIQHYYINKNRSEVSNTKFSFGYPGYEIANHSLIQSSDIVNFHWIEEFQSALTLQHLFETGKEFVWTMHDERPYSGGYHYAAGCTQHQTLSEKCELLLNDPFHLPYLNLKDKLELFKNAKLTIITPSKWLASEARKSILFKDKDIRVIPNSLETDIFYPIDKAEAKKSCKINPKVTTLLFACENNNEKRKGFKELIEAMKILLSDNEIIKLKNQGLIELILIGIPNKEIKSLSLKYHVTGYIYNDQRLREIMSAADIFVLPPLEDNLPNMMLESMACGTCAVAFNTGGITDVVKNNENGLTVKKGNSQELASAMKKLILEKKLRESFNKNSAELIKSEFKLEVQANRYLEVYEELNKKQTTKTYQKSKGESFLSEINYTVGPNLAKFIDKIAIQSLEGSVYDLEYSVDKLSLILHNLREILPFKVFIRSKKLFKKVYGKLIRKRS